jgi:hypothetical protein
MTPHTDLDAREALAERLVNATTHALETLSVHLRTDTEGATSSSASSRRRRLLSCRYDRDGVCRDAR